MRNTNQLLSWPINNFCMWRLTTASSMLIMGWGPTYWVFFADAKVEKCCSNINSKFAARNELCWRSRGPDATPCCWQSMLQTNTHSCSTHKHTNTQQLLKLLTPSRIANRTCQCWNIVWNILKKLKFEDYFCCYGRAIIIRLYGARKIVLPGREAIFLILTEHHRQ